MLAYIDEWGKGVFSPETIHILVGAFDDAWKAVASSGAPFSEPRHQAAAREIIAKHIIALARLGERDQRKLTESALLELAGTNLRSGRNTKPRG